MTDAGIAPVKLSQAAALRLGRQQVMNSNVLNSWDKLMDYIQSALGNEKVEQLRLLLLNRKNVYIADEVQQKGTIDYTPLYIREVV